jgi:hypothetical protein
VWRIRYNDEIYKMYKDVPLSTYIGLKILMRAGHVVRMEEHSIPKKGTRKMFWRRKASGETTKYMGLEVVMGRHFVSALRPVTCCTIPR